MSVIVIDVKNRCLVGYQKNTGESTQNVKEDNQTNRFTAFILIFLDASTCRKLSYDRNRYINHERVCRYNLTFYRYNNPHESVAYSCHLQSLITSV